MYVMNLEMAHEGTGGTSPHAPSPSPPHPRPPPPDAAFHHQIMQLKKQQQLQQEILLQHFQQQRQQLAEQHEQQLRHHLKLWEQQKAMEEAALREAAEARELRESREREQRERERDRERDLRKDKHEPCANASTQVKQKLQEFLKKKQAAANANGTVPGSPYRNWGIVKSSSGESITGAGGLGSAHPYRLPAPLPLALNPLNPLNPAAGSDYPLRKTASEPNMLKVRLKARVFERRASPLARRPAKARHKRSTTHCEGSSPRGSPPGGAAQPIREEEEGGAGAGAGAAGARPPPDLLFSSPSMPNISLGRPHAHAPHHLHSPHLAHQHHTVTVSLPPVCEAEAYLGSIASGVAAGAGALGQAGPAGGSRPPRPLGRTHSAPLPLGEPALLHAPTAHHYLRDQIRKTVLTRAHDAAAAQLREEEGEVIDLTSRRVERDSEAAVPASAAPVPAPPLAAAPLARALSSPLVGARSPATGLAYDALMLKHGCACGAHAPTHPEHGGRLQSVWARLCETGLAARTERTRPRKATLDELQSVHTESHVSMFGGRAGGREVGGGGGSAGGAMGGGGGGARLVRLPCGGLGVDSDTAWAEGHTAAAARAAAGAVLDLALRTARGELRNGFAVVRPPGHHAESNQAMGFCFFNNVAVAARILHTRLRLQRILIVDWDVHHGNGTQQIFYEDPHVLYMSLHRHDEGNFFPGTGSAGECGAGRGLGYTVNVPWAQPLGTQPPAGDAEYLAAFRTVVMPIAKEFDPELVLVSCGFDAAAGHPPPLGGYAVSPACFAHMTRDLMQLAGGKVVLSLEGGYELPAMCDCAQECVRALLGESGAAMEPAELQRPPCPAAAAALRRVIAVQAQHWPTIKRYSSLVSMSAAAAAAAPAAARPGPRWLQSERDAADTARAMATLSMRQPDQRTDIQSADSSRSVSEEPMEQDEGK